MRHLKSGRKLKRNSSHRKALLNNLATSLFEHKKIETTEAKAKELRAFAETLITKAKHALRNEKLGLLPEGHKVDIHNRRMVGRFITNKAVLQELFNTIAPMVEERPGGYTRIIKLGPRRGDGSPTAIIELVDWSAPQDGAVSTKSRRKGKAAPSQVKKQKSSAKEVETTPVETKINEVKEPDIPATNTVDTNFDSTETNTTVSENVQEEGVQEISEQAISEDRQVSEEIKSETETKIEEIAESEDKDIIANDTSTESETEEDNKS